MSLKQSELKPNQLQSKLKLIDESFEKQANFLLDPSRLKAALCTRRAGKSYGAATAMFAAARDNPGCSVLYLALTRDSAKKIMWKDCIKTIDRKFKLHCRFNETNLTATLSNGSVIYLAGADAKPDEMEKLLGQKYKLVVIDEGASWKQDLEKLVLGILKPAVADDLGTIMMIGTPGNITKGFFKKVTDGEIKGWSVHKWTAFDNPYMRDNWAQEIKELKENRPGIEATALFRQMYLGEWYVDESALCYKFGAKNLIGVLPEHRGGIFYVLGVDLGYADATAFSLSLYSEFDKTLYFIETIKQQSMIVSDVAIRIHDYVKRYPKLTVIVDGANKQAVEEFRQRYGLSLQIAEKTNKAEFIEIMNADMLTDRIKLLESTTKPLQEEWAALVWDEDAKKRQEHPSCENHLADASLYAWRYAYNYLAQDFMEKPKRGSEEEVDDWWDREAERLQSRGRNVLD